MTEPHLALAFMAAIIIKCSSQDTLISFCLLHLTSNIKAQYFSFKQLNNAGFEG